MMSVIHTMKQNTFRCDKGGSQIDIMILSREFLGAVSHQFVDEEIELFTLDPRRGHISVWTELKVRSKYTNTV